jgi:hypothetical protein
MISPIRTTAFSSESRRSNVRTKIGLRKTPSVLSVSGLSDCPVRQNGGYQNHLKIDCKWWIGEQTPDQVVFSSLALYLLLSQTVCRITVNEARSCAYISWVVHIEEDQEHS